MTLPLTPLGQASSWGSLLRAYELWALDDDDLHRRFCGQLMRELPGGPRRPAVAAERAVPGGPGSRRGTDRAPRRHDEEAGGRPAVPGRADARVLGDHPARRARPGVHAGWSRRWPRTCASWRGSRIPGPSDDGRDPAAVRPAEPPRRSRPRTRCSTSARARADLSRLLVLDDTALLVEHAPVYERLDTARRVEDLLCVAVGPRAGDGRTLRLPGNLGGTQGSAGAVGERPGRHRLAGGRGGGRHRAPAGPGQRPGPYSSSCSRSRRCSTACTRPSSTKVPGRVASPGLRLAGADDEAATFAAALALAIRRLCDPGPGTDGPFAALLPAPDRRRDPGRGRAAGPLPRRGRRIGRRGLGGAREADRPRRHVPPR